VLSQRAPTSVNLGFIDRSRYFSFKYLLIYPHEAEWTPSQAYYSENLVAPVMEPGISWSAAKNSDHKTSGGRSVGIVRLRTKGHGVCFFFIWKVVFELSDMHTTKVHIY
jgi:hypothetical protein